MQLLTSDLYVVFGVALDVIEDQEVLSKNEQACLGSGATLPATMITVETAIPLGVGEAPLDRLASHSIAVLGFLIIHLLSLSVE